MTMRPLTSALLDAGSCGSAAEIEKFFKELLSASIFIPAKPTAPQLNPIVSSASAETLPYLFITHEGESCIPIFSEEEFLKYWAEREINIVEEDFKSFIWRIPNQTALYLNSNQDIGKELSPWEVELLKKGLEAIPELVAGVLEAEYDDLEIEAPPDELLPLCHAFRPILEIYSELEEAFLLSIREAHSTSPRALVGLRYSVPLPEEKMAYIRTELERTAEEHLVRPFTGIFVVDDLGSQESMNQSLFLDVAPFYTRKGKPEVASND
ncbi:MAG TPA: SseB family protein [Oligoflexia bacterium]|nr:SseB family protein [Oligoflexia bacterium]HMP47813.1 SseB family protein [Oligoflexia bacterium]